MMRSMSVWCSLIATGARSRKGYLYGSYIGARGGRYGNQGAVRQFLGAEEPIGAANALGASIPATVSAMRKAVCSFMWGELSSFWGWCFCASTVATCRLRSGGSVRPFTHDNDELRHWLGRIRGGATHHRRVGHIRAPRRAIYAWNFKH
jgi:hypothetical protein